MLWSTIVPRENLAETDLAEREGDRKRERERGDVGTFAACLISLQCFIQILMNVRVLMMFV